MMLANSSSSSVGGGGSTTTSKQQSSHRHQQQPKNPPPPPPPPECIINNNNNNNNNNNDTKLSIKTGKNRPELASVRINTTTAATAATTTKTSKSNGDQSDNRSRITILNTFAPHAPLSNVSRTTNISFWNSTTNQPSYQLNHIANNHYVSQPQYPFKTKRNVVTLSTSLNDSSLPTSIGQTYGLSPSLTLPFSISEEDEDEGFNDEESTSSTTSSGSSSSSSSSTNVTSSSTSSTSTTTTTTTSNNVVNDIDPKSSFDNVQSKTNENDNCSLLSSPSSSTASSMEPIEQLDFISTSSFAALLNDMRNCGDDDDDYDHYSDSIDGRDHQLNHLNRRNNNNTNQVQRYRHRTQSSPSSSFNSYSSSSSSSTSSSSSSSYHQQRPPPPSSLSSMMIITGPTGSVRGKRNIVRKSINNYTELVNQSKPRKGKGERNFHREDYKRVVLFTTSLGCIRKSFDDSKALKAILDNQFIVYEERDLYLSEDYRLELKERFQLIQSKCWAGRISNVTKNDQFRIPALFVSGFLLGNFEEVEKLNEIGKLARILEQYQFTYIKGCLPSSSSTSPSSSNHFEEDKVSNNAVSSSTDIGSKDDDDDSLRSSPIIDRTSESSPISFVRRCSPISNLKMSRSVMPCVRCGERRFVNCDKCNGSRKTVVHHFHCGTVVLRCTKCSKTGLIRCPNCVDCYE